MLFEISSMSRNRQSLNAGLQRRDLELFEDQVRTWCMTVKLLKIICFCITAGNPISQAYIPKRRTLIQVLPPANAYTNLLMHTFILPDLLLSAHTCMHLYCNFVRKAIVAFVLLDNIDIPSMYCKSSSSRHRFVLFQAYHQVVQTLALPVNALKRGRIDVSSY